MGSSRDESFQTQSGKSFVLVLGLLGGLALASLIGWVVLRRPELPDSGSPGARAERGANSERVAGGRQNPRGEESSGSGLEEFEGEEALFEGNASGSGSESETHLGDESSEEEKGTGSVSGRVTDSETGAPATGMKVVIRSDEGGRGLFAALEPGGDSHSGTVDEEGRYEVVDLPAGQFTVSVETGTSAFVSLPYDEWGAVELEDGEVLEGVDFSAKRGGRVFGTFALSDGQPVEGATVRATPDSGNLGFGGGNINLLMSLRRREKTDEEGQFEIRGLPFDTKLTVTVQSKEHASVASDPFKLSQDRPELEIDLAASRGSSVLGIARFADGRAAAEVKVYVVPKFDESDPNRSNMMTLGRRMKSETTDENGGFRFDHLPAGDYTVRGGAANPFDFLGTNANSEDEPGVMAVSLDGVGDVNDLVLTVEDPGEEDQSGAIAGTVRDDQGNPLAEVGVSTRGVARGMTGMMGRTSEKHATTSDAEGNFVLEGLKPGTYTLAAKLDGYEDATLQDVPTDGPSAEITLNRLSTVRGFLVTGKKSLPSSFKVRAQTEEEAVAVSTQRMQQMFLGQNENWVKGESDGSFVLKNVPSGSISILADAEGFAMGQSESFFVNPGQDVEGIEIRLVTGGVVRGKVLLSSGEPVFGAKVKYRKIEGAEDDEDPLTKYMPEAFVSGLGAKGLSDKEGEFVIRNLAMGRYVVSASHPQYAPSGEVRVFIAEDAEVTVSDLILKKGGTITGVVLKEGEVKSGVMVQVYGDGPMQMATSDDDGEFRFERLNPGDYRISYFDTAGMRSGGGMSMKTEEVTIQGEETVELELKFGVGKKIYGEISGLGEGETLMVVVRRPGGPGPEDYEPTDVEMAMEAAKYQAGLAFVGGDGEYSIKDIEPGTYIVEVPATPQNLGDIDAYSKMDRTPRFREEVEVGAKDLKLDIRVRVR